jgi:arylformamidase
MARLIDISMGIEPGMLSWPGTPPTRISPASRVADGAGTNVSEIALSSHSGTHVDPPAHRIDGAATADELSLDLLFGDAFVADVGDARGAIGPHELDACAIPAAASRVLLKTRNSRGRASAFSRDYASLSPEGARWMIDREVCLVGIDFLSIEAFQAAGRPTHTLLLQAGVVIVEGLVLDGVQPGPYTFVCLPLKVVGGDGAPARAILLEDRDGAAR